MVMKNWEPLFQEKVKSIAGLDDPAHDYLHFQRVVKLAKMFCLSEGANIDVVLPAAWLHDLVIVPKNHPDRNKASKLSANEAIIYLESIQYPNEHFKNIAHAIECHSFSANKTPETLEAFIVQDADRLDGVGAIGVARCFATAGLMKRTFYNPEDPFCQTREPDDSTYTVDHFYNKLFKTVDTLKTKSAQLEGERRLSVMKGFLEELSVEL